MLEEYWMNKVVEELNVLLVLLVDRLRSDYDDVSKRNMLMMIDLMFVHNDRLLDDIELN